MRQRHIGRRTLRAQPVHGSPSRPSSAPRILAAVAATALAADIAQASGHLPPLPVEPRHFPDFEACFAHLLTVHRSDQDGTEAGAVEIAPDTSRRKIVETRGIERTGAETARYQARVGFEIRVANRTSGYIETTFSYEDTRLDCRGRELSGTVARGYMLPGRERM